MSASQEIVIFKQVTESRLNPDFSAMRDFFKSFCSRIATCERALQSLSNAGMPAWLILFEVFRLRCTLHALRNGDTKKYKDPAYWQSLVNRCTTLMQEVRCLPTIVSGSDDQWVDTERLVQTLESWANDVRKTGLLRSNVFILYSVPPNGLAFVRPGYEQVPSADIGRPVESFEVDESYTAAILERLARELTGQPHHRELASILYSTIDGFGNATEATAQADALRNKVKYFVSNFGAENIHACANATLKTAKLWFGTA